MVRSRTSTVTSPAGRSPPRTSVIRLPKPSTWTTRPASDPSACRGARNGGRAKAAATGSPRAARGREDVAAVERVADRQPLIARVGERHAGGPLGQGDAPAAFGGRLAALFRQRRGEDAVVRADKHAERRPEGEGAPFRAHAGVYHRNVDGAGRKVRPGGFQQERPLLDALWTHGVADIDDDGVRVEGEDDALHGGDVRVGEAEVAGEGNDGPHRHGRP